MHVLPTRTAGAAENMAVDFLLLQRYPQKGAVRFRHYEWRAPAFTFGYSQKIAFVRAQLPPDEHFDLCRRPTGGGVVDHRDDWTYALVIPRGHPLEKQRAAQSYRLVHEALAETLRAQGVAALLKPCAEETGDTCDAEPAAAPGVCFQRAEPFDVIHAVTREKIAGAAQKRNKHGLLFQGSLWKPAALGASAASGSSANALVLDWDRFHGDFTAALGRLLGSEPATTPWPEFNEGELEGLAEQYSATEWLEQR